MFVPPRNFKVFKTSEFHTRVYQKSWQPGGMSEEDGGRSSQGVREWKVRKAMHVESPLVALQRGDKPVERAWAGVRAEARMDGALVAKSERAQVVNKRVYFPVEDCSLHLLRDSSKRWR